LKIEYILISMQIASKERLSFNSLYQEYRIQFNKPADPLVFYIHWYMIKNEFDSIIDTKVCD
jgi:hypothetical protein